MMRSELLEQAALISAQMSDAVKSGDVRGYAELMHRLTWIMTNLEDEEDEFDRQVSEIMSERDEQCSFHANGGSGRCSHCEGSDES